MLTTKRARWLSLILLIIALLAALSLGALKRRQDFLTRGIPAELPGPIAHAGTQLGINVYLNQYDDAELAENLTQIADAGIQHIKQPFYYSEDFDWDEADRVITAVSYANLTLTPLLDGNPADNFAPPANPGDYAQWVAEFAQRYGEKIQHYIIWNEPNLTTHWGSQHVNPAEYAALLTAASSAIRSADTNAVIVAAPLAPNEETGPKNLADHLYLQQLYEEGAGVAFDVAAGKPYGFHTGPDDRTVANDTLNFSRLILMREVMAQNGDGDKALWAGNWGWNSLPEDWPSDPSVWGQVSAQEQADWTLAALERSVKEWPWAGILFLENWEPDAPEDDARWGFSVKERLETGEFVLSLSKDWRLDNCQWLMVNCQLSMAAPGFHLASPDGAGQVYEGGWRFSPEFGADISQIAAGEAPDKVTFTFWGTEAGLRVRRENFRARLNITIDGKPANALPQDENGAVLVLTAPDPNEDYLTIETVATNLEPGVHVMEVVANRGWNQWALNGFSVRYAPEAPVGWMWLLAGTAVFSLIGAIYTATQAHWGAWLRQKTSWYAGLSTKVQVGITAVTAAIVALTGWLTWGAQAAGMYRRLGDGGQIALTAGAAAVFYVAPSFYVYVAALLILFLLIYFRPAWGVVLIAFCIPFYVPPLPKAIFQFRFSPVEIFTLVTLGAWLLKSITDWRVRVKVPLSVSPQGGEKQIPLPKGGVRGGKRSADLSVLALVIVATVSLFFTERLGVATNEWRMVIVEPALFYLLLRGVRLKDNEMWVVLDAFVLSGLVLALIGLYQYLFVPESLIMAEGGLMRVRSIFGSPNNLALYLSRMIPLLFAMLLLGKENGTRRWLYSLFLLPMGVAVLLTFSKGALILGLPAAFLYIFWRWQQANGRSTWPWVILFGVLGVVAFAMALQIPAIAGRIDPRSQTAFFRLNLWQASLNMVKEQPWFGVGLDNFLYAYRGRYILDAAWQEPNLNHPHNIFLDFATRLGIFGLIVGFWMFWEAGKRLWHKAVRVTAVWQPVLVGFGGALLAIIFHGLVDHSFFLVDLAYAFMLILGTAVWLESKHV